MSESGQQKITFIGCGCMAEALVAGLLQQGYDAQKIIVANRGRSKLTRFANQYPVCIAEHNAEAVKSADIVILAVKPAQMQVVCEQICGAVAKATVIVSVAAGIELNMLRSWLGGHSRVIRVMPNLAAGVAQSATALYADAKAQECTEKVESVFSMVGDVFRLSAEEQISVATVIAGSGPAYFYFVSEAIVRAAENLGMPTMLAKKLTKQTALGAAQLALPVQADLQELRQSVTSSKGTTAAAIECMLELGLDEIVIKAVKAAYQRSLELKKP